MQGSTTTSTVPSTSNKISAVGGTNITYDSSGNFITYGTTAYSWNAAGQLSFTSTGGATVGTYTYNASNQRTKKVAGANTVQYVYGLNGLLYGEYDNSGAMIREYVYQNDEPLAQIDAGSPEVLTYLHPNHLGTPQYGTDTGGSQVWFISADSYGVGTPSGSRTVNLRMPGQYYDAESGLFYNWNRYYSPALGRYISSDPIGIEGGPNTFNYAEVSPVMYTDPEGLLIPALAGAGARCAVNTACRTAAVQGGKAVGQGIVAAGSALLGVLDTTVDYMTSRAQKKKAQQAQTANASVVPMPPRPNVCTAADPIDLRGGSGGSDGDDPCELMYKNDTDTCNGISRVRSPQRGAECHKSASERYAACLTGKPIPPLNTWNN